MSDASAEPLTTLSITCLCRPRRSRKQVAWWREDKHCRPSRLERRNERYRRDHDVLVVLTRARIAIENAAGQLAAAGDPLDQARRGEHEAYQQVVALVSVRPRPRGCVAARRTGKRRADAGRRPAGGDAPPLRRPA